MFSRAGLTEYKHEQPSMRHVLQYDGKYYVCGNARQALVSDKTADDRYYLLILVAIVEEIKARDLQRKASIILVAGLPLTRYGRERDSFSSYLKRTNKSVCFLYEGKEYQITISQMMLFLQGFSAVAGMKILNEEPVFALLDAGHLPARWRMGFAVSQFLN